MTADTPKRILTVRIDEPLFLEVRAEAGGTDRTNAQVVTAALREFFARRLKGRDPQPQATA